MMKDVNFEITIFGKDKARFNVKTNFNSVNNNWTINEVDMFTRKYSYKLL